MTQKTAQIEMLKLHLINWYLKSTYIQLLNVDFPWPLYDVSIYTELLINYK